MFFKKCIGILLRKLFSTRYTGFGYTFTWEYPENIIRVSEMLKDSPAADSAMQVGDIVVSINNITFSSEASLVEFMHNYCANICVGTATIITLQKASAQNTLYTVILSATKLKSANHLLCKLHNMREYTLWSLKVMMKVEGISYNRRTKKIEVWHDPNRLSDLEIEEIFY